MVEQRRGQLLDIVDAMRPMTVRQVFYQATVRGIIEKTEAGYGKVQTDLTVMRRSGELPYDWLADNTRWQRKPRTFNDPAEALRNTAKLYRKNLWADADSYVEVWLEKDALSGIFEDELTDYGVTLNVGRGYDGCYDAVRRDARAVEQGAGAIDRGRLCPAELCPRRSLPVRLEP